MTEETKSKQLYCTLSTSVVQMQHPTMDVQPEKAALRHVEAEGERASHPRGAVLKREAFVNMAPIPELGSYRMNGLALLGPGLRQVK